MLAATRSRRKKIRCFATGLRYGAIGRGICLKSELFKLRQAPKRRQRMLRNDRGAFFRLRLQAAFQRVRRSLPQAVSLPCGPIRAPVSGGKICTPVSAVPTPRFRRGGERGSAPLPHSEPPYPRLLRNHFIANFAGSDASRSWQGALRFWLLLSPIKVARSRWSGTLFSIKSSSHLEIEIPRHRLRQVLLQFSLVLQSKIYLFLVFD